MTWPVRFLCFASVLIALTLTVTGCGGKPKVSVAPLGDVGDVNKMMAQLDSKKDKDKLEAIVFLQLMGDKAQPAVPKLQELASKSKNEAVKKKATEAIAKISGS